MENNITDRDLDEMANAFKLMDAEGCLRHLKHMVLHEMQSQIGRKDRSNEYLKGYRQALHVVCIMLDTEFGLNPYVNDGQGEDS